MIQKFIDWLRHRYIRKGETITLFNGVNVPHDVAKVTEVRGWAAWVHSDKTEATIGIEWIQRDAFGNWFYDFNGGGE